MSMLCALTPGSFLRKYLPLAACVAGAVLVSPQVGMAQSASPFANYAGNWRGSGRVVGKNGNVEPIRCRATYSVSPSGWNMSQALVCASDSYRFDIRSNIVTDGRRVQGSWQETTRNTSGNLTGRVRGGLIESSISGPGFTAQLVVRTVGRRQTVSITPQGADVSKVDITMAR